MAKVLSESRINGMNRLTTKVFGIPFDVIKKSDLFRAVDDWINENKKNHYIVVANLYTLALALTQEDMVKVFRDSGCVISDGKPVQMIINYKGFKEHDHIPGFDLFEGLIEYFKNKKIKHYFVGYEKDRIERLTKELKNLYPYMNIAGSYFVGQEFSIESAINKELVMAINKASPDILWVGFGCPKQEKWMSKYSDFLKVPVMAGIGAVFDFSSGLKKRAPKWMQSTCVEWLYRFVQEPKRLFKRYCFVFVTLVKYFLRR
ncbi:MAG: WecB/TagA/CpsF family glycosyltransferase [Candidatus Omnitrophica bacterium]|nr:WecB/TagA/CpsF family glycosyltransferase [Candidatus Omnitrophota bacterium]